MGRRLTTEARNKKRLLSQSRRRREDVEHVEQHGIPKKMATPFNMLKVASFKRRKAKSIGDFKKVLDTAKLVSVVQEDFEYCGLSAKNKEVLEEFRRELEKRMSVHLGKKEPESVLDSVTFEYLQESIDLCRFVPIEPPVGVVPKARKFRSGRVQVLRAGEPDYDFLVSSLRISAQKEK